MMDYALRQKLKSLNVDAISLGNVVRDDKAKLYSVQFFDLDGSIEVFESRLTEIMEIFPYDCFSYKSKHGFHFISLGLLKGSVVCKKRAQSLITSIPHQDYTSGDSDLALRVSPKWRYKRFRKLREISPKPIFFRQIRRPIENLMISKKHLEFYHKHMGLPDFVYDSYKNANCREFDYSVKVFNYRTVD